MKVDALRYCISDWDQAEKCLSNNSKDLHISVTRFVNNRSLVGRRISVTHTKLGVLFSTLIAPSGQLVSTDDEAAHVMSVEEILSQLALFGFLIKYREEYALSGEQLSYLIELQRIGFDKICPVIVLQRDAHARTKKFIRRICAIDSGENSELLIGGVKLTEAELAKKCLSSTLMDITDISLAKKFQWDWLTYPISIQTILDANGTIRTPIGYEEVTDYDEYPTEDEIPAELPSITEDIVVDTPPSDTSTEGFHIYTGEDDG